jgi:serine/threonine protein kinase
MSGEQNPQVIGEYKIMRPVARGVMGMVYVGTMGNNVFHAVKLLDPRVAEKLPWATKFVEDVKGEHLLAPKLIDIHGDRTYVVTEYLEVKPISRQRLQGISSAILVGIVADIAEALQKVHDVGLCHGNVKTSNILVRRQGGTLEAMVSDFGIQYIYDKEAFTPDKVVKTFSYMSPERAQQYMQRVQAKDVKLTPQMDIYSLGVSLCEILTGAVAYSDMETPETILEKKKNRKYVVVGMTSPTRKLDLALLNEVVAKSTAYDAPVRYRSMKDFAKALRECIVQREGAP